VPETSRSGGGIDVKGKRRIEPSGWVVEYNSKGEREREKRGGNNSLVVREGWGKYTDWEQSTRHCWANRRHTQYIWSALTGSTFGRVKRALASIGCRLYSVSAASRHQRIESPRLFLRLGRIRRRPVLVAGAKVRFIINVSNTHASRLLKIS
jgi:hypothetical protein